MSTFFQLAITYKKLDESLRKFIDKSKNNRRTKRHLNLIKKSNLFIKKKFCNKKLKIELTFHTARTKLSSEYKPLK